VLSHSHNQLTDGLFDIEFENTETESELFGRGAFQLRSKKLREHPGQSRIWGSFHWTSVP